MLTSTRELAQQTQMVTISLSDYRGAQGHAFIGNASTRDLELTGQLPEHEARDRSDY